jgi:hypothetical protein
MRRQDPAAKNHTLNHEANVPVKPLDIRRSSQPLNPPKLKMKNKRIVAVSASALTVGLAHGQVVTNSQIIYTYANVTVPTTTAGYAFDLNQDGHPDFQVYFSSGYTNKPYLDTSSFLGQPNLTPAVLAGSGGGLPVTPIGTPINSSYGTPAETAYFYAQSSSSTPGAWDSNGTNVQGYVGLVLTDNESNSYYGWAQFVYNSATEFDGAPGEITLIDYAFDQNAGEAILTGENAPPGSAPQVAVAPVSLTNAVLTTVQYTVIGTGNPYPTYQWLAKTNGGTTFTPLVDGGPISGSLSNVLTISNVVPGFSGTYEVQLQNADGSATAAATLSVAPLTITGITPSPVTVFPGATASLNVSYSSAAPILSFQWLENGAILNSGGRISGTTSSNLVIQALATTDTGNYSVIVSNMYGAATSAVDVVTVRLPSTPYEQQVAWTKPLCYYALNETNNPASGHAVALDFIAGANGLYGSATENGNPNYDITGPLPSEGFLGFSTTNFAVAITNSLEQPSSIVTIPPLNFTGNTVTFTLWINPAQAQPNWAVLDTYLSTASGGPVNGVNYQGGSGSLGYHWNNDQYNWNSGLTPPIGQWSFIALVIMPTGAIEYMFNANGMAAATNVYTSVVQTINVNGGIGGDLYDANFTGDIDQVATFGQSLTQTQLTNLWTAATTGQVTPPPATLSIQLAGQNVVVSWVPPVGTLLQATSLNGPWTTINAATSPYTNTPAGAAMFYQVVVPQ